MTESAQTQDTAPLEAKKLAPKKRDDCALYVILSIGAVLFAIILLYIISHPNRNNFHSQSITTPFVDKNTYRALELDNRLRVLLVHNPEKQLSSAALEVGVGSFSDPPNLPGLAHFLEHLLFMGSSKYPSMSQFAGFLANASGSQNAFTQGERTNYHFQIAPNSFEVALDMFAHMFIDPLFSQEAVTQEVNAINSEFQKNFQIDDWRAVYMMRILSSSNSPFSRFSIGDLDTLSKEPKEKGIDVIQALKDFFDSYYSSNIMSLVVSSNHTLDTLETWVRKSFESIPNKDVSPPTFGNSGNPFVNTKKTYTEYLPISAGNSIYLTFFSVPLARNYQKKPLEFFKEFIEYKGEGSLTQYFANLGYASNLEFGPVADYSFGSILIVRASLEDSAVNDPDLFLEAFFSYIDLIRSKGVSIDRWNSQARQASIDFNYTVPKDLSEMDFVRRLVGNLAKYELKDVLAGDYLFMDYDNEFLMTFLDTLTIDNCMVLLSSPLFNTSEQLKNDTIDAFLDSLYDGGFFANNEFGGMVFSKSTQSSLFTNSSEVSSASSDVYLENFDLDTYNQLYKLTYGTRSIPDAFVGLLRYSGSSSIPELALPAINPYIPENLQMICNSSSSSTSCAEEFASDALITWPKQLSASTGSGFTWYKMDRSFRAPVYITDLILRSSNFISSAESRFKFLLYCDSLTTILNSELSLQKSAGYEFTITCENDAFEIKMAGYSDKLDEYIKNVTGLIASTQISEERFNFEKRLLLQKINNTKAELLFKQAFKKLEEVLTSNTYSPDDLLSAGTSLTYSDWQNFNFLQGPLTFDAIIVGNVKEDLATEISNKAKSNLGISPVSVDSLLVRSVATIQNQSLVYREFSPFTDSTDNLVLNYYLDGMKNVERASRLVMLQTLIENPAYDYLRTQKQLGYIVLSRMYPLVTTIGLGIIVQGSEKDPNEMNAEIEKFLATFGSYLANMSESDFELQRNDAAKKYNMPPHNLDEKVSRFAVRVKDLSYQFNFTNETAGAIAKLTKDDVIDYYNQITRTNVKKLSVQVYYKQIENSVLPTEVLSSSQTYSGHDEKLIVNKSDLWTLTTESR